MAALGSAVGAGDAAAGRSARAVALGRAMRLLRACASAESRFRFALRARQRVRRKPAPGRIGSVARVSSAGAWLPSSSALDWPLTLGGGPPGFVACISCSGAKAEGSACEGTQGGDGGEDVMGYVVIVGGNWGLIG